MLEEDFDQKLLIIDYFFSIFSKKGGGQDDTLKSVPIMVLFSDSYRGIGYLAPNIVHKGRKTIPSLLPLEEEWFSSPSGVKVSSCSKFALYLGQQRGPPV